ncbi:hypothetical protein SmJEL517_g00431 [Synchytrium microbalum]|uniref:Septation initiation network scaffold protein cdc11 n=1 Tax=Synchytrium microbalum TaxID=1806994 RepID=A0A507C9B6_9FUNG|nr:uncharacterized protein SmJEL517_g00431 [Synchytrium microbalum]TPX37657.1 hypothetical protein SmJEL517_g00431 [Synchytrium microbalum]
MDSINSNPSENFGTMQYRSSAKSSSGFLPTSLVDMFAVPALPLEDLFRPLNIDEIAVAASREPMSHHSRFTADQDDDDLLNDEYGVMLTQQNSARKPAEEKGKSKHNSVKGRKTSSPSRRKRISNKSVRPAAVVDEDSTPRPKGITSKAPPQSKTPPQQPIALDLFQQNYNTVDRRHLDDLISGFTAQAVPMDAPVSPTQQQQKPVTVHENFDSIRIKPGQKRITSTSSNLYPADIDDLEDFAADQAGREILYETNEQNEDDIVDDQPQPQNEELMVDTSTVAGSSASQSESPTKKGTIRLIRNLNGKALSALMSKIGTTSGMVFNEQTKQWEGGRASPFEISDSESSNDKASGEKNKQLDSNASIDEESFADKKPVASIAVGPDTSRDDQLRDAGVSASIETMDATTSPFLAEMLLHEEMSKAQEEEDMGANEGDRAITGYDSFLNHEEQDMSPDQSSSRMESLTNRVDALYEAQGWADRSSRHWQSSSMNSRGSDAAIEYSNGEYIVPRGNLDGFGEAIASLANLENSLIIPFEYDEMPPRYPSMPSASSQPHRTLSRIRVSDTSTNRAEILPLLMNMTERVRQSDWMSLQRLDLRYQQVTSTKGLGVLMPNLEELDVTSNDVTELIDLPDTLRILRAADNRIPHTTKFISCAALEVLDLSRNNLEKIPDLTNMLSLQTLRAHGNGITSCSALRSAVNLKTLDLSDNELTNVDGLQWINGLETVLLRGNRITGTSETVRILKGLKRLQLIDLRDNPMTATFYTTQDSTRFSHVDRRSSMSSQEAQERERDIIFVSTMSDTEYVRRLLYRSTLIYSLRKSLRHLDGCFVDDEDRTSAR